MEQLALPEAASELSQAEPEVENCDAGFGEFEPVKIRYHLFLGTDDLIHQHVNSKLQELDCDVCCQNANCLGAGLD